MNLENIRLDFRAWKYGIVLIPIKEFVECFKHSSLFRWMMYTLCSIDIKFVNMDVCIC